MDRLFDRKFLSRQFASACPALEESQRLEPRAGTLFTLAECQAQWGKVASAVAHYQEYVGLVPRLPADQQSRHRDRVKTANSQIAKLKPTVPTLTLLLPADVPAGTSVTRNGVLLQGAALGLALPSDPGEYVIVTRTPGGAERPVTISVALGEAKRVALEVSAENPTTPASCRLVSENKRSIGQRWTRRQARCTLRDRAERCHIPFPPAHLSRWRRAVRGPDRGLQFE